jgi:hypothetical protein
MAFSNGISLAPVSMRAGDLAGLLARLPGELLDGRELELTLTLEERLPDGTRTTGEASDVSLVEGICSLGFGPEPDVTAIWSEPGGRGESLLYASLGGDGAGKLRVYARAESARLLNATLDWFRRGLEPRAAPTSTPAKSAVVPAGQLRGAALGDPGTKRAHIEGRYKLADTSLRVILGAVVAFFTKCGGAH